MIALTATKARANLYRLIDQAAKSHEPVLLSLASAALRCSLWHDRLVCGVFGRTRIVCVLGTSTHYE
jgi:hypothetical protein